MENDKEMGCQNMDTNSIDNLAHLFDNVIAISGFFASEENQLSFFTGDCIRVLDRVNKDWFWGKINGEVGYIPANHVRDLLEFEEAEKWQDDEYFGSYNDLKLHLEMLNDVARTEAYQKAVLTNAGFVRDKIVLDVGCGTGILSMFCARDGAAKQVYAIEASSITDHVTDVIKDNKLGDIITVIKGRIENITLPEKVDMIISEWMGTFLLFEFMIDSVLYARDHWLKQGGTMWPSIAKIFLVPCIANKVYERKIHVWTDQYGFNFSKFKEKACEDFFRRPVIDHMIKPVDFLSMPLVIKTIDMNTIMTNELESWSSDFDFLVEQTGTFHAFGSWFDVEFHTPCDSDRKTEPVVLSTGPNAPKTHWKNAIFCLNKPYEVVKGDIIRGSLKVERNPDLRRHMTVVFEFIIYEKGSEKSKAISKEFKLWR